MDFGKAARSEFLLQEGVTFLNHGSFGATPRAVLAAQDAWRARMERQPYHFMHRELPGAIRQAAADLAGFLGARGDDLVFVDNATAGINAVARSVSLEPGDEILVTDHVYPAVRNALSFVCQRARATLVEAPVPFPLGDDDEVIAALAAAIRPGTRLAVLDHVTSPTAVKFPIERLIALFRARGVSVLVDGAHAPGMLEVDVPSLGADWYVGNAHKWLFAPKGCGFLWAAPERQEGLHPAVISHGLGQGFAAEFDWTGTRDPSAWLAVSEAVAFHRRLGSRRVILHNHKLAAEAAVMLAEAWGTEPGAPEPMLGAMAAVRAPHAAPATLAEGIGLRDRLWNDHGIEAPVIPFAGALWVRISAQVYNEEADYLRLARAVGEMRPPG
jgi:isopenicillin-N epimerase